MTKNMKYHFTVLFTFMLMVISSCMPSEKIDVKVSGINNNGYVSKVIYTDFENKLKEKLDKIVDKSVLSNDGQIILEEYKNDNIKEAIDSILITETFNITKNTKDANDISNGDKIKVTTEVINKDLLKEFKLKAPTKEYVYTADGLGSHHTIKPFNEKSVKVEIKEDGSYHIEDKESKNNDYKVSYETLDIFTDNIKGKVVVKAKVKATINNLNENEFYTYEDGSLTHTDTIIISNTKNK